MNGVGGAEVAGDWDLCASQLQEQSLLSLLVKESEEGAEVGVGLIHIVFSAMMGLFMVLRKSV